MPPGTSVSNWSSRITARSSSPARLWSLAACKRRVRPSAGSSDVRRAASSASSAAAAGAPRAAACPAAMSSSEAIRIVRTVGGEREVAGPLLEVGDDPGERAVDRHGASRAAPVRNRSRRATGGRNERGSRRARRLPRGPRCRAPPGRASRSPCAAATSSIVGLASAATKSTDVAGLGRQPGEPAAEKLVQALGNAQRLARAPVSSPVRTSSRPSSSAKNGLPPDASRTRASSGRVSSRPIRSSSRR